MNEPARQWELLQQRFHDVLTLPPGARDAALTSLASSDPSLAAELRLLLEAHDSPGPLGALEVDAFVVPEQVGPYRLLSALGEGGMGTVWLAERRQEDVVQRVALKLLRTGVVDKLGMARRANDAVVDVRSKMPPARWAAQIPAGMATPRAMICE
jgi:serine/threonine-protein kinase